LSPPSALLPQSPPPSPPTILIPSPEDTEPFEPHLDRFGTD
jgi:hypothetical protein